MTSSSTALSGSARNAQTTASPSVRATSPAKSRLTVRLPDLNAARPSLAAATAAFHKAPTMNPAERAEERGLADTSQNGPTGQLTPERDRPPAWVRTWPRKTLDFVRQPKFWLACIVAVAVQVVLAFVMTPAEGVSDGKKPAPAPSHASQKAAEEPAPRIVVPAAPVSVPDDRCETAPAAVTTPMGPALPFDPTSDTTELENAPKTVEARGEQLPAARVADKPSLATGGERVDGRSTKQADGATLGGIAPLDLDAPPARHEAR